MRRKTVYYTVVKIIYLWFNAYMNEKETKIIHRYKKISNFIFHYLIFFVALVVALIIFQRIIVQSTSYTIFGTNDTLLMQKTKLIAWFSKFLKQNIKDNDMNIHILQWDLEVEQWFITSVNNLVDYKWFIVPRYFYLYNTLPVKQLSYFSWGNYDVMELENFINNFVFTKKIITNTSFINVQLPLEKALIEDFNLACIFENKISNITCNYYLGDFLDSFFIYDISADYIGLKNIFDAIQSNTTNKGRFCEWLSKYLLYANDQNDNIKELFSECGQHYEDMFKRTTLFMEIQKTLENQSFEKISYKDPLLNEYKLLSYQQQIYQDFLINKADSYKISIYLDFVKEVLKKDTIAQFYKDEIYWYNNDYLSLSLEKMSYQSTTFTQNLWWSKIASLITMIDTLNEGEPMLGLTWLINEIQNKLLITPIETSTWSSDTTNIEERIQKKLQSISYLTIEKKTISETTIDIIWYLKFFSPDKNETIKSHIIIDYINDMLLVKSIELQNKPEINDVIKNLLLIQNFSIWEIYSYISKNLVFYEQDNAPISATNDLCPWLQALTNITLVSCTNTLAKIDQNSIHYEFTLQNGGIENITISDKYLENSIKMSYSTIIANTYTLIDSIQAILNYKAPLQTHEGTTNAIVVFEKIQQYLWIKANDIADKDGKILVDISLGGINFIINYTLSTNTLGPWYFKDILVNGKPYTIQNFNLPLDDAHQNDINTFVIDPLTVIKNADLTAWQNYNEKLKVNN